MNWKMTGDPIRTQLESVGNFQFTIFVCEVVCALPWCPPRTPPPCWRGCAAVLLRLEIPPFRCGSNNTCATSFFFLASRPHTGDSSRYVRGSFHHPPCSVGWPLDGHPPPSDPVTQRTLFVPELLPATVEELEVVVAQCWEEPQREMQYAALDLLVSCAGGDAFHPCVHASTHSCAHTLPRSTTCFQNLGQTCGLQHTHTDVVGEFSKS